MGSEWEARTKVLRIIARMNVGGPAIQVTALMEGLGKFGIKQELITGYCEDGEEDYLKSHLIELGEIRIEGLGRSLKLFDDLRAFFKIRSFMKRFNPDIVHTHTAKAGVLGRLASLSLGKNAIRVHTFHGHLLYGYFSKWKTRLVILLERFLAARTDALVAVGQKVADDLLIVGIGNRNKYSVIPPGFPAKQPEGRISRGDIGISTDSFCCLWIGRLVDIKRPERILEIAREIRKISNGISFLVVGGGPHLSLLQESALKESLPITFLGWREDVEELIALSDLMILTSDNEGTPLSLIQAQRQGKPVLSTDVGSVREVMIQEETGFALSYDAKAFAIKIQEMKDNPGKYDSFSRAALKFSSLRFSEERLVNDYVNLYSKLILRRSNS